MTRDRNTCWISRILGEKKTSAACFYWLRIKRVVGLPFSYPKQKCFIGDTLWWQIEIGRVTNWLQTHSPSCSFLWLMAKDPRFADVSCSKLFRGEANEYAFLSRRGVFDTHTSTGAINFRQVTSEISRSRSVQEVSMPFRAKLFCGDHRLFVQEIGIFDSQFDLSQRCLDWKLWNGRRQ